MFCPMCGGLLTLISREPFVKVEDWFDLPEEEQDKYLQSKINFDRTKRKEYICYHKNCRIEDTVLYHHQPFQGIESAPGDSWSLSWIK